MKEPDVLLTKEEEADIMFPDALPARDLVRTLPPALHARSEAAGGLGRRATTRHDAPRRAATHCVATHRDDAALLAPSTTNAPRTHNWPTDPQTRSSAHPLIQSRRRRRRRRHSPHLADGAPAGG